MALQLVKHKKQGLNNFNMVIYGAAGAGKTTLASTFPDVLYVDTQSGTKYLDSEFTVASVNNWAEVKEVMQYVESGEFKTVVYDVVKDIYNMYVDFLKERDSKLFNSVGQPTMQGWGVVKAGWNKFINLNRDYQVNTIFVCHDVEKTDNDNVMYIRPDLVGSSSIDLFNAVDFVGYKSDPTMITFAESAKFKTKDRHGKLRDLGIIYNPTYDLMKGIFDGSYPEDAAQLPAKFTSIEQAQEIASQFLGWNSDTFNEKLTSITARAKAPVLRQMMLDEIIANHKAKGKSKK